MKNYVLLLLLVLSTSLKSYAQKFEVNFAPNLIEEKFAGNILLYLSKDNPHPREAHIGINPSPVFRVVTDSIAAGEKVTFDDTAISFPVELSNIERGTYYAQVVFDRNLGDSNIGTSTGNLYSNPIEVKLSKEFDEVFSLNATEIITSVKFPESQYLNELIVPSKLLSDFHQKEIYINGGVALPQEYFEQPERSFPVIFSVFGFGANYKIHSGMEKYKFTHLNEDPVIVVYLDGNCPEGHSTYANSDVNGPWGDALVQEFIPALEAKYRTNGARFLFGHSSGGWTSLWLQINYPKAFAGTWSSAPDQVDFRNYQNKNIYETTSMFYDARANLLPDITIAARIPVTSARDFYLVENVIYRGSQLHSFDAVFGGYDEEGNQIRLVDIPSGEINPEALPLWKRYDLSLLLIAKWPELKNDLDNKIRISIGTSDNFFLHEAVYLLDEEMKAIDSNIEFDYFPGDHFTVFTHEYKEKGISFLEYCYENWISEQE